ncbi:hypothetical protein V6N13_118555 [Hibiscus sabdariffa]|uniref:S-adenosyl-L-methionine-dependent methyltransferase n=1 Tax=Hibiscus sabdariffa TaxID=183260 RepID=A0ABR2BSA2_9ROSI
MGSVSLKIGDGTARFKRATLCSSAVNILMLFSVIITNLFALYAFTYSPKQHITNPFHLPHKNISLISQHVSLIMKEIDSSQRKLAQMEKQLLGYDTLDLSTPNLQLSSSCSCNIITFLWGRIQEQGSPRWWLLWDILVTNDWSLAQKLILKGCEPLPRRRCFAKTVPKVGLTSLPVSLWKPVSEKILTWSGLGCKNFNCLNNKKSSKDCVSCFDLVNGYETQKYIKSRSKNDFLIDDVLAMGSGGIRIGFDIGGGSGTFAARMAEKNVTVITNTLNVDAPYGEFIAARGLFPLFLSLDHRFPFYDNVFDLVHATSGLDDGGKPQKLEFLMFDIDRILRAGGLFWLDNFPCADDEKKRTLTRLIERFGYKKLKWVIGDGGSGKPQVYLSAVLQKPVRI